MHTTFEELPLYSVFLFQGGSWYKQSSRTAPWLSSRLVFYFGKKEVCRPGQVVPKAPGGSQ